MIEKAGLKPVRVELIPKDMTHDGTDGLAKWINAVWLPYVEKLPPEKRAQFVAEFVERYTEQHPVDKAGFVHVPMMRLEVEAAKPLNS